MPVSNQVNTAARYLGSNAATAFAVLGLMGFLSPEQIQALNAAMNDFTTGIGMVVSSASKMWIILGPLLAFWLAKVGIQSSSVQGLVNRLLQMAREEATPASDAAKVAIVNAAAALPEVEKVVAPELAIIPTTAPEVVVR
jgi:hypothetical protein